MRLDQLFLREDETTVKTMSMPEKVSAFDRLQPGQEIGLWFDSVIRRADKYKPFVVGRKTKSKLRPIEKITLLQKSKDGGTGGMKYYLYKRNDDNVSLAMGDMAASLVDIKEAKAYDINEADATIMERIVLDIDYSRNPEALLKAVHAMGKRLDLTLMNAPQAIKDLKEKGFARIEGKDADIMSFVNYLYSKGIEPNYDIQNMDKVMTPGLNKNKAMPAFIGKKEVPTEGFASDAQRKAAFASGYDPKKKKKVKEGYSNARHQAQTMLKLEELRDMIMVLDMEDDSKTSALTALDQVADDITVFESKDGANTSDGMHQEKICRDTVKNPNKSMLGGPSPEEAEKTLRSKFGYSDDKISKLKEEFEPHKMYKDGKVKMANTHADHVKLGKQGWSHDKPKTKKIDEMPIPLSTMYGLVIDGKYVAKGSKEKMRKMQKEKGGTVYNAPGKKVGDSAGTVKEKEKNCGCGQTPCKTYGKKIEEQAPHTHHITEAEFDEAAGEKDACYHKVKSRYKVWPSAYASGALTKCRKVGAANWGNSKKK